MSIHDVCDYVITRVADAGASLSNLKLQKLMYYVQAWYLAFYGKEFFDGKFEAWVHGPVSRDIYDRFVVTKSLYSDITLADRRSVFTPDILNEHQRNHIDNVLEVYAKFSGPQLEELTHDEDPWIQARNGCERWERCNNLIDEGLMQSYYASQLA